MCVCVCVRACVRACACVCVYSVLSGAHKRKERVTWLRNCLQTIELRMCMCGKHVISITKYGAFRMSWPKPGTHKPLTRMDSKS